MKCSHCGAENNEGAKFCSNCGTPIQIEKAAAASETVGVENAETEKAQTASKLSKNEMAKLFTPMTLIGLTLSSIAFVAGLILYSLILERGYAMTGPDTLVFIPAFAGLALGIYALLHAKDFKSKVITIATVSLAGFAIFYGFLTYCICLG